MIPLLHDFCSPALYRVVLTSIAWISYIGGCKRLIFFFSFLSAFTSRWCSMKKRLTSPHPFLFLKITIDLVFFKKTVCYNPLLSILKVPKILSIKYSNCHNLVNGSSFKLTPVLFFWHVQIRFWALPYTLTQQGISGSCCTLLALDLESVISAKNPDSFSGDGSIKKKLFLLN